MRIKRFNELSDDVLKRASRGLIDKGHYNRGIVIDEYIASKNKNRNDIADDIYTILPGRQYSGIVGKDYKFNGVRNTLNGLPIKSSDDATNIITENIFRYRIFFDFTKELENVRIFSIDIDISKFIYDRVKITLNTLPFDRRSALKFKRNLINNIIESTPLSEVLMLNNIDVDICSKVFESIESIRVNDINSYHKDIILFDKVRRNDQIWRKA